MELLQMLTGQLGISEEQAKGGAGLLFKMAKAKLASSDFSQVTGAVPEIENLISAAPKSSGLAGTLGGLTSSLGGGTSQLGNLAGIAGGFQSLDLDANMIGKFIPIALSFVQSKGGVAVKDLLEDVLK